MYKPNYNKIINLNFKKCPQNNIYNKFNLNQLGLPIEKFNKLRLSYNNLPIDENYPGYNNTKIPTRFRRYSEFQADIHNKNLITFCKNENYQFSQNVDDFRKKVRTFQPMESKVLNNSFFQLLTQIIGLTIYNYPNNNLKKLNISIHQVRLLSYPHLNIHSDNSPEGIHRDGADYIVSALVLNKYNITNGISSIYDSNKNLIYKTQLQQGEFIFQEDKNLWHDISKIKYKENFIGYRDILGFDIKIIE